MLLRILIGIASKSLGLFAQLIIAAFIYHYYGAAEAGIFGVLQGVTTVLLMSFSMALPRLVAVKHRYFSYTSFVGLMLVATILSAFFYSLIVYHFIECDFFFATIIFLIKACDCMYEINAVVYRRRNLDARFATAQLARLVWVLCMAGVSYLYIPAVTYFLLMALFGYVAILLADFKYLKLSLSRFSLYGSVRTYGRLLKEAYPNVYGAFISTAITTSPRYVALWWFGAELSGLYYMVSYVYLIVTMLWSIIIQLAIVSTKNIIKSWRLIERRIYLGMLAFYIFMFVMLLTAGDWMVRLLFADKADNGVLDISLWLVAASIPLVVRDLNGYRMIKLGLLAGYNLSSVVGLVFFWLSWWLISSNAVFVDIGIVLFAANLVSLLPIIFLSTRGVRK